MPVRKTDSANKKSPRKRHREPQVPFMSEQEFERLNCGQVAYIKRLSSDEAMKKFPDLDVPKGINLFALLNADGTYIALTDTRQAALSHAIEGELEVASLN